MAAMAAIPPDADALADFPLFHAGAEGVDDPGDFVARNARVLDGRESAFLGERIGMADTARLHFDANLA
jgi:hypothetical protein